MKTSRLLSLRTNSARLSTHLHTVALTSVAATLVGAMALFSPTAFADQHPIRLDGRFDDWSTVIPSYVDGVGDGNSSLDLETLWLADDDRFLFLRLEVGVEQQLDEGTELVLYLDTDANATTGAPVGGLGAELEWRFGERGGTFYFGGASTEVSHDEVRLRSGPTVSSLEHEVAIGRDTLPDGSNPLFTGSQIRLLLRDESGGGDQLPDAGQTVTYTLDQGTATSLPTTTLSRALSTDLRLVTYNVLNDSPWDSGQEPRFGRQFAAVNADIFAFQEIRDHSASETATLVGNWVAAGPGTNWNAADHNDCIVVTRFPILQTWNLDGNLAVRIDTTSKTGAELLLVNAHLPCCANESGRQEEIDRILSFVRDARTPGGAFTLASDTAIVITGDLNLVGLSSSRDSLVEGDIADESTFGPDFSPDWDDTALTSLISLQTEKRMAYTWRNDSSSFWPGMLDFVIYSDSVVEPARHYIIYTPEMSGPELAAAGLQAGDSLASDHLLRVADFRPTTPGSRFVRGDCNADGASDISDPIRALDVLFGTGAALNCADSCDVNDDGGFDLSDAAHLAGLVFGLTPNPPSPFPFCGEDPTTDGLDCSAFSPCP